MKSFTNILRLAGALAAVTATAANGQVTNLFGFDEFGKGYLLTNGFIQGPMTSQLGPDPTGGLPDWNVLSFNLPFAGVAGDVAIQDPAQPGSPILDVLRFDGDGHVIVYSDNINGYDAPGDTPGPPDPFLANLVFTKELGIEEVYSWADYSPTAGQPGWDAVMAPNYHFISDGVIPEPGVGALLLSGLGALAVAWRRRSVGCFRQASRP